MEASGIAVPGAAGPDRPRLQAASPRYGEKAIKAFLAACAGLSIVTTTAIVISLLLPAVDFFREVGLGDFFLKTEWAPAQDLFGVIPLVVGSFSVVFWGMVFAVPIGLGAAIYLSEYATPRVRRVVKPILEILAGIPTVAIGFFGVAFLTPLLQDIWPGTFLGGPPGFYMAGAAGLCIGLMIVPIIASISEDAMSSVPSGLREGAYALGASKMRVSLRVVFPAALSGIVASLVLAVSRAVGETMIVLLVAGNTPNVTFNPVEVVQALTAYIGVTATGDIAQGTTEYDTVFAVGFLLFALTLVMNLVAIRFVRKYRQVYE
jgi:phosphate transport system permease protein